MTGFPLDLDAHDLVVNYGNSVPAPVPEPGFQRPPLVYEYPAYRQHVNTIAYVSCNSFAEVIDKHRDATLTWQVRGFNSYDNDGKTTWVASWAHALGLFLTWKDQWPEVTIYRKADPHTPVLVYKLYGSKT